MLFDQVRQGSLRQGHALTAQELLRAQSMPVVTECRCAGIATREERLGRSVSRAVKGVPQAIAHSEVQRQYTVYEFVVTDQHGASWKIEKRFSEIKQFKHDLVNGGADVVKGWELPSKIAVTKSQRKMAEETINQRKAIVETFLSLCVSFCGGHPLVKVFFSDHSVYPPLLEEDGEEDDEHSAAPELPVTEGVPPYLANRLGATLEEPEPEPEQEPDSDEESEGEHEESTSGGEVDPTWATNDAATRGSSDTMSGRALGAAAGRWTVAQLLEDQAKLVPAEETRQQLRIARVYQSTLPTQVFDCVHVQKRVARRREGGSNMRSLRLTSDELIVIRPPERISAVIEYVNVIAGRIEGDNFVMLTVVVEGKRTRRRYQCGRARGFVAELSRRVLLAKHIAEKTARCSWADKQSEDTIIARQTVLVHGSSADSDDGEGWSAMTGWDLDSLLATDRSSDDSGDEGGGGEAGNPGPAAGSSIAQALMASDPPAAAVGTASSDGWQVGAAQVSAADAAAQREEIRLRSVLAERMQVITGMTEGERLSWAVDKLLHGEKAEDQHKLARPMQSFLAAFDEKMATSADTAVESTRQLLEKAREIIMALRMDSLRHSLVEIPVELVGAAAAAQPSGSDSEHTNGADSELAAANTLSHIIYARLESAVIRPLHSQLLACCDQMAETGNTTDLAFEAKRRELRACGQEYYGIPAELQSPSGWAVVISKLNALSSRDTQASLLPSKQLVLLVTAASSVYTAFASEQTGKAAVISGDDFLPIFIYIVVQSQLTKLSQMWHYMYYLADPVLLRGEGGYYLGVFEAAVHYISNWSLEVHSSQLEPPQKPILNSEPEPEPEPQSQNHFNLLVTSDDLFPGEQRKCLVFARDLSELQTNLAESLGIGGVGVHILLHDAEFEEYYLPNSIDELAESSSVKIKAR